MFVQRADHEARLRALGTDLTWRYADSREETLRLLRESRAHVVYFYCHGGLTATNVPYLTVGPPARRASRATSSARCASAGPAAAARVHQRLPHDRAEPGAGARTSRRAWSERGAAGVIGTEITNFEPLASAFAEECLRAVPRR